MAELEWEKVEHKLSGKLLRAKVLGGWLDWKDKLVGFFI